MIKLTAMVPNPADATSLYRALGPLIEMERTNYIALTLGAEQASFYDWHTMRRCDVFFAQRPCLPVHAHAITGAKQEGVPVWVDLDDDLFNVPYHNPTYPIYSNGQNRVALIHSVQMADIVTVTTQALADVVSDYNPNVRVIPNAYDDVSHECAFNSTSERKKIIAWRGGQTHVKDLESVSESILAIAETHQDWSWSFLGYDPTFITRHMKPGSFKSTPFVSNAQYRNNLNNLNHAIQIVPLTESSFNRCKSNIAWIEAAAAGAQTLARDWPEWQHPEITHYKDEKEFEVRLLQMMSASQGSLFYKQTGFDYIQERLTLSHMNAIRYDVLRGLVQ